MCEFATQQPTVRTLLTEEREKQAQYDFSEEDVDWKSKLTYMPRSKLLENSVWNLMLILTHDPDFAFFGYNEMASRIQVIGKVPWERPLGNRWWRDADTAQMKALIDIRYLPFSTRNHDVAFTKVADDRHFHPIRDYLDKLPPWPHYIPYLAAAGAVIFTASYAPFAVADTLRAARPHRRPA